MRLTDRLWHFGTFRSPTPQWFLGTSLDGSCPIGPRIVTADEVENPRALTLCLRVNGQERQHCSTTDMIFTIARAKDVVEAEVRGIGVLRNRILFEVPE